MRGLAWPLLALGQTTFAWTGPCSGTSLAPRKAPMTTFETPRVGAVLMALALGANGLGCSSDEDESLASALTGGPLARGGDLFLNSCRQIDDLELVCSPFRMSI